MSDEKFPRAPDGFSYGDPVLVVGGRDPRFAIDEHRRWTVHEYIPVASDGHPAVRYREPTEDEWATVGGAAMAAFDAIEAACWDAEHVVVMEQRALLQAGPAVRPATESLCGCMTAAVIDHYPSEHKTGVPKPTPLDWSY